MPEMREMLVHTPQGSGPDQMARGVAELLRAVRPELSWQFSYATAQHGGEAMQRLRSESGRSDLLGTCTPSFIQTPLLHQINVTVNDLVPVARVITERYLLLASPTARVADLDGFRKLVVDGSRTAGYMLGSVNHLAAIAVEKAFGAPVEYLVLPSPADIIPALERGDIDWAIASTSEARLASAAGRGRPLASVGAGNLADFPELPPLHEAGVALDIELWRGLVAPPDVDSGPWEPMFTEAAERDDWQRAFGDRYGVSRPLFGAEFREFLKTESDFYSREFAAAGLLAPVEEEGSD